MDKVDATPFQGWSADGPMLEGINTTGFRLYADIGRVEAVADVVIGH